jgi:hypothetical protein|tara:strand:+ start:365 stop:508 length:144 start_codon:yes stop_codon:yes gene_type:complete
MAVSLAVRIGAADPFLAVRDYPANFDDATMPPLPDSFYLYANLRDAQ